MRLIPAAKARLTVSCLLALLVALALPAAARADNGGDRMERPQQMRVTDSGDVSTSVDPYEGRIYKPETEPAHDDAQPPSLESMVNQQGSEQDARERAAAKIHMDAMKEAALSFGARGGLARRTWEIRQTLDQQSSTLDRTYNFSALLISAPSGLQIEPPIVTEAQRNVIVAGDGQEAAVSDVILKIGREARIVTASRDWRTYLERDWGKVAPPPDVLLPRSEQERLDWSKWVQQGWEAGYRQGDEIFQADIDRLVRDYTGMVRYRALLAQNMISAPFALQEDRGITGGGNELRIGDRALSITGQSQLQARPEQWQPVPR